MTRELLQQAIDALIVLLDEWTPAREAQLKGIATIAALREALTAPEPEPVAWCELTPNGSIIYFDGKPMIMVGPVGNECHTVPLFTSPPAAPIDGFGGNLDKAFEPAPAVREPQPFTKAQLHRLYVNSPELHKDAPSEAAFTRIVQLAEQAHGIGGGGK